MSREDSLSPLRASPSRPNHPVITTATSKSRSREWPSSPPHGHGHGHGHGPLSPTPTKAALWKRRVLGWEPLTVEEQAEHWARRFQPACEILLEKLFAHLSTLPEESNDDDHHYDNGGLRNEPTNNNNNSNSNEQNPDSSSCTSPGMTLPAAAVGWLASQLYPLSQDANANANSGAPHVLNPPFSSPQEETSTALWMSVTLRDRLRLLRFLLPRVTHLRITRQEWPPELQSSRQEKRRRRRKRRANQRQNYNDNNANGNTPSRPTLSPPEEIVNCSTAMSVSSVLTLETIVPPTRQEFWEYMQRLQNYPRIDLRVFPNVQVLVLERITPTWIYHLDDASSLQVLRINRACVYRLPRLLFPSSCTSTTTATASTTEQSYGKESSKQRPQRRFHNDALFTTQSTTTTTTNIRSSTRDACYPHLTHVNFEYCGIGELSGLPKTLSKLTQLECLSLAHNKICTEKTALNGLRPLSRLAKLNLSYNQLTSLPNAYQQLGGQLQRLQLSHNHITTAEGLDRLYALEELWLDHNCIASPQQVSGLARLPQLQRLYLRGNPMGNDDKKNKNKSSNDDNNHNYRPLIFSWFQQNRRATTPDELPILDGIPISNPLEWSLLQKESFSVVGITTTATTIVVSPTDTDNAHMSLPPTPMMMSMTSVRNRRVQRRRQPRKAKIQESSSVQWSSRAQPLSSALPKRPSPKTKSRPKKVNSSSNDTAACERTVAFSVQDVLRSLQLEVIEAKVEEEQEKPTAKQEKGGPQREKVEDQQRGLSTEREDEVPGMERFSMFDTTVTPYDESPLKRGATTETVSIVTTTEKLSSLSLNSAVPRESKRLLELEFVHSQLKIDKPEEIETTPLVEEEDADEKKLLVVDDAAEATEQIASDDIMGFWPTYGLSDDYSLKLAKEMDGDRSIFTNGSKTTEDAFIPKRVGDTTDDYRSFFTNGSKPSYGVSTKKSEDSLPNRRTSKIATVKLQTGATRKFDIFSTDWDELVQQAAEGLIPNGKSAKPSVELEQASNLKGGGVFSTDPVALLSAVTTSQPVAALLLDTPLGQLSAESSEPTNEDTGQPSALGFRSNALPEHVFQDDFSVPSSLGTNRDDFPRSSKFQVAEDNAVYDGPDACRDMNVVKNLELYFNTFVFPSSVRQMSPEEHDAEVEEDWQTVALRHPRIQLWPEDRRWLETTFASPSTPPIVDWAANRERCVRVWEEDVIPCGKPALRRLAPNRRTRLGFHGDQLYTDGSPEPFAECRKVYLCLSSSAFYILLRDDPVTKRQEAQGKRKKFPVPIGEDSTFQEAPWPHAVVRHSFQELQAITIGFEFQRLTLRFSNPSIRKAEPFVYALLTSNKRETVGLLQEIQHLAKEANDQTTDLISDATAIAIENDSQVVFDALALAVAPDLVGTVLHYQVVQQRWKHGERGTVRRVCIVTDSKMFLLDEDYNSDGHKALESTNLANVSYRIVDEASLKQVAEVQAAGADPTAITIVINPLSRLSRTHRWRLVCRDSAGAERLVEDVRKTFAVEDDE